MFWTLQVFWCKALFFLGHLGDVDGSIEAINDAIATYKSKKITLNVLSSKVGAVSENDIRLAQTFKGKFFSCGILTFINQ